MKVEGSSCGLFQNKSKHSRDGFEENTRKKCCSEWPMSRPRIEHDTFQLQTNCHSLSTATFCRPSHVAENISHWAVRAPIISSHLSLFCSRCFLHTTNSHCSMLSLLNQNVIYEYIYVYIIFVPFLCGHMPKFLYRFSFCCPPE